MALFIRPEWHLAAAYRAAGKSRPEIAEILGLHPRTIQRILQRPEMRAAYTEYLSTRCHAIAAGAALDSLRRGVPED